MWLKCELCLLYLSVFVRLTKCATMNFHALSSAALLASGYRYRPWLSSCLWHSVDGEELGHGGPPSQGPRWAVSPIHTTTKQNTIPTLTFHIFILSNTQELVMQLLPVSSIACRFLAARLHPNVQTSPLLYVGALWAIWCDKSEHVTLRTKVVHTSSASRSRGWTFGFRLLFCRTHMENHKLYHSISTLYCMENWNMELEV